MQGDPAIQEFLDMQPWKYNWLTRFDVRLYYSVPRGADVIRVDLWLGHREKATTPFEPQQLHLICYEVDLSPQSYRLWPIPTSNWRLVIKSIHDRHLSRLNYAIVEEEMETLFHCFRFEARIEEVEYEYSLS